MRLPALSLLAALALLGSGTAPAQAITRDAAGDRALELLRPTRGNTAVFGLPEALPGGTRVAAAVTTGRAGEGVRLRRPAFLFWKDESHGARFSHPGELLVLDARSGRVVLRAPTGLWPVVDGRVPAFLRTRAAYLGRRFRVDRPAAARAALSPPATAARPGRYRTDGANGPFQVTREHLTAECMVIVGDRGRTSANVVTGNVRSMARWARDVGMRHAEAGPTPAKVTEQVDAFVASGCRDVFVYLTGHGQPGAGSNVVNVDARGNPRRATMATGGPAAVITDGLDVTGPEDDPKLDGDKITPADLQALLRRFPSIEFKLKIDACFSGRFWEPLTGRDWRETGTAGKAAPYPNLRVLEVSSAPDEVTYAKLPPGQVLRTDDGKATRLREDKLDDPDDATYFTNANLHGLYEWARNPGAVDPEVPRGAGPSFPRGLAGAFDAGRDLDVPRTAGLTHPRRQALPPLPVATTPAPEAPRPKLTVTVTWRHIGPGASEVCVIVAGLATGVTANVGLYVGLDLTTGRFATVTGDAQGGAVARFPITSYASFAAYVSAGAAGEGTGQGTITDAPGTCPPP